MIDGGGDEMGIVHSKYVQAQAQGSGFDQSRYHSMQRVQYGEGSETWKVRPELLRDDKAGAG